MHCSPPKTKERTRIKPRIVTVVHKNLHVLSVPKRNKRKQLQEDGRIQKLSFLRTMSWQQVKNTIIRGFRAEHNVGEFPVLEAGMDGSLIEADDSAPNGETLFVTIAKGSLYLKVHAGIYTCIHFVIVHF